MTAKRIGYTVVETDRLHPKSIEGAKTVDEIWVPSEHNRQVFEQAGFKAKVIPYPLVMPPYVDERDIPNRQAISGVFENTYCMYAVTTFQERKNVLGLITAFLHAFRVNDDVALLIKVAGVDAQQTIKDAAMFIGGVCMDMQIEDPPKIRLLGGEWTEPMMWGLHARGDCYVSLARGEAFGIPLLDAAAMGNQVTAVKYGGHVDFLPPENTHWVPYRLTPVLQRYPHFNGYMLWADADVLEAAGMMKRLAQAGRKPKARPEMSAFSTLHVAELLRRALHG
jgi:glycosyltransferase involved in cell wall biosynthesis